MGDMAFVMLMQRIANYQHHFAWSSASVVRDHVYSNVTETLFSPVWNRRKKLGSKYQEQCHFPFSTHQVISWAFIYSVLQVAAEYCGEESSLAQWQPPALDIDLGLEDLEDDLRKRQDRLGETATKECALRGNPCVFAWTAGPEAGDAVAKKKMEDLFAKTLTINNGWQIAREMKDGWARKLGLVASKSHAKLQFDVTDTKEEVTLLNLITLKSYGEKWEGSKANFTIQARHASDKSPYEPILSFEIEGVHDSHSSISYTHVYNFPKSIPAGSNIRILVDLVGGSTFKITGMMVCNH